ncbi:MAG TPA: helix-turn-helix domain-containing protein [Solirubrobacterales bacterium]|jgi:hypothetical protein
MTEGPKALCHPVRRRVVRRLHRDFEPRTVAELCDDLALNQGQVRYHGEVLATQGIVKQYEGPGGLLIESLAAEDPGVISVLLSTQICDRAGG